MRSDLACPDSYGAQMSDLDNARRLLVEVEAREIRVFGYLNTPVAVQLVTAWVAITNAAIDEKVWGNQDEV